jgi:predicted DNA-binding protein with PD1-like motif
MLFRRRGCQYVLRLDPGEEVRSTLWAFADREGIRTASFLATGVLNRVELRCFDVGAEHERVREDDQPVEVVSLIGSIVPSERTSSIHMHATVIDAQAVTHHGHLDAGTAGPALEVFLTSLAAALPRQHDPDANRELLVLAGT